VVVEVVEVVVVEVVTSLPDSVISLVVSVSLLMSGSFSMDL
jgi:hypothetical protein